MSDIETETKELPEWIQRARKGKTKAPRVQTYLHNDEYDWFTNFRKERGIGESQACRLCIRHVMIEHKMREAGRAMVDDAQSIDIAKLVDLRGDLSDGDG